MNNVFPLELNAASAKKIISELAQNSANVIITDHVKVRMKQRRITTLQVFDCLKKGILREGPAYNNKYGSWEVVMEILTSGDIVKVIAALKKENGGYVVVITTYKGE